MANLSKKIRFEVFKRDSFTCQYCGKSAPEVVLNADHIDPSSKGGSNNILNLITSCESCNSGKSDRRLSDTTVVNVQIGQLKDLQARQEQLEMLLRWRESFIDLQTRIDEAIGAHFIDLSGFHLHKEELKKMSHKATKLGLKTVLDAIEKCCASYLEYDHLGTATDESICKTVNFILAFLKIEEKRESDPHLGTVKYVIGILRNRLTYFGTYNHSRVGELVRTSLDIGVDAEELKRIAARSSSITRWESNMTAMISDHLIAKYPIDWDAPVPPMDWDEA